MGLGVCVILSIVGIITLIFILKPYKEAAAEADLAELHDLMVPSIILDRNGSEMHQIDIQNRRLISIDDVPFHFIQTLTAAEDSRFFEHDGVDYMGIARAIWLNIKAMRVTQGASTLTQQLAKLSFNLRDKSVARKLTEAFLAKRIEEKYSKSEILELYLNRIYFGHRNYGIKAAAEGYFNKDVSELTIPECATLCGLIKSPYRLDPFKNKEGALKSRNNVLRRLRDERMISDEDYTEYLKVPLEVIASKKGMDYVDSYIVQKVIEEVGEENATRGGFRVYTTIDTEIQAAATESLRRHLASTESRPGFEHMTYSGYKEAISRPSDPLALTGGKSQPKSPDYLQGSMLMIDNKSGGIVAMVGGRDYKDTEFNRATQAFRPAGTIFTPFVFAAAFQKKFFPGTTVKDDVMDNTRVGIGGMTGILGEWGTETKDSDYEGSIPAREALVKSKNAATVRMGMEAGLREVLETAKKAGLDGQPLKEQNSAYLGGNIVSLEELCQAYTIFPNGGKRPRELHIIKAIRDKDGTLVYSPADPSKDPVEVIDEIAAYQVHSCLTEVLTRGSGQLAGKYGLQDKYAGGKTGTAYDFTDVWFVGYNSSITCGVWAGFDKPRTSIYHGAFSNEIVLPIWTDIMNASAKKYPSQEIAMPKNALTVEVCRRSGRRATDNCYDREETNDGQSRFSRSTYREVIRKGTIFDSYCDFHSKSAGAMSASNMFQSTPGLGGLPGTGSSLAARMNVAPIPILAQTVIGDDDPYNSVKPVLPAKSVDEEPELKARKATPINTDAPGQSDTLIQLAKPGRMDVPSPD
jgi:membrane peptidoglycan carboxypeptidase